MDCLFHHLLPHRLDRWKLICIMGTQEMGQSRIPAWSVSSDLRIWCCDHSDFHHSNPSSSLLCQFPSIPLYLFLDHSNQSNLVLNCSYLMSIIALTHTILYHYTPYSSPLHSLQNEWFCSLFLLIVAGFRKVWKSLVLECSDDKFRSYHIYDDDKSLLTHSLIVKWIRRWRRGGVSLRRNDSIDSRSCMPWKVVWLPFGEVPGRKQILDWWAVELA